MTIAELRLLAAELEEQLDRHHPVRTMDVDDIKRLHLEGRLAAGSEAQDMAVEALAMAADWDVRRLKKAMGPDPETDDEPEPTWRHLVWLAQRWAYKRANPEPTRDVGLEIADRALFGAAIDPTGAWAMTHARHARKAADPAGALRLAIANLDLVANEGRSFMGLTLDYLPARHEARRRLEEALSFIA